MAKKYNHMFDVAFTVECEHENYEAVPVEALVAGLAKRLQYLIDNPAEAHEAFGYSDTYEI